MCLGLYRLEHEPKLVGHESVGQRVQDAHIVLQIVYRSPFDSMEELLSVDLMRTIAPCVLRCLVPARDIQADSGIRRWLKLRFSSNLQGSHHKIAGFRSWFLLVES